jgi:transposase-like protein
MGTPGPQKTKRYSLEFKLQAVAMSQQPGVLVQDVAESLCIHSPLHAVSLAQRGPRWPACGPLSCT